MDNDEIGPVDHRCRVRVQTVCRNNIQLREPLEKPIGCALSVLFHEVCSTPTGLWLESIDVVAAGDKFAQQSAEKMRIAVVPARDKRMREICDLHAHIPSAALHAETSSNFS